jgi:GH15 family glucan-1,4-alpha-glucosidase
MKKLNLDQTDLRPFLTAYQPIENYGIIGDLNTTALIGLNGSIDFLCFPDFDSPTIFAALLDKDKGGFYSITPKHGKFNSKQLYLPETNILLTRFLSEDGIGEITDFMPVQELDKGNELIRKVTTVKGCIRYRLTCSPRFNYGLSAHQTEKTGLHEITFSCNDLDLQIRLKSNLRLNFEGSDCILDFTLNAGESADFILLHEGKFMPEKKDLKQYVDDNLKSNINYWKSWSEQSTYTGRWMEIVNRSALVLKLLTSNKYGSLIAAPTFALPEEIGGERNWDYRYTWIRDASFTVYCLLNLGYTKEAGRFIDWVENKCFDVKEQTHLQIMYKLNGGKNIKEKKLSNLEGYKKSAPVRIGNAAYKQIQLDIYGELLDAVYLYDKHGEPISYDFWQNLSSQVDWLAANWKKKDDGIWEVRGGKKHFLYSRLMCWVAFDRAIKIANNHSFPFPNEWQDERNKIFKSIHDEFWNEKLQSFVQFDHADTVDAATLMMPIVGFIGPKDPKWLSTLKRIDENLVDDFLVYRYHNKQNIDGLRGHEGTFSMCTFWYIECLALSGQLDKATLCFEKMLGYANALGLYAEQLGFSGEHLGNYPQAFTHLGLISAAINLNVRLNDSRNIQTD